MFANSNWDGVSVSSNKGSGEWEVTSKCLSSEVTSSIASNDSGTTSSCLESSNINFVVVNTTVDEDLLATSETGIESTSSNTSNEDWSFWSIANLTASESLVDTTWNDETTTEISDVVASLSCGNNKSSCESFH